VPLVYSLKNKHLIAGGGSIAAEAFKAKVVATLGEKFSVAVGNSVTVDYICCLLDRRTANLPWLNSIEKKKAYDLFTEWVKSQFDEDIVEGKRLDYVCDNM
jgi:hypothetical protein